MKNDYSSTSVRIACSNRTWDFAIKLFCSIAILFICIESNANAQNRNSARNRATKPGFELLNSKSKIEFSFSGTVQGYTSQGCRFISVSVFNGDDTAHDFRLIVNLEEMNDYYFSHPNYCQAITGSKIQIDSGATATTSVFIPNVPGSVNNIQLAVDGVESTIGRHLDIEHITDNAFTGSTSGSSSIGILFSPDHDRQKIQEILQESNQFSTINSGGAGYGYGGSYGNIELLTCKSKAGWSDEWIFYSAFAMVVLSKDYYDNLPIEVKNAIRDYVAAGGNLSLTNTSELPDSFDTQLGSEKQSRRRLNDRRRIGVDYYLFGMGQVNLFENSPQSWNNKREYVLHDNWVAILDSIQRRSFYDARRRNPKSDLPIVNEKKLPLKLVFWGVFFFLVLIGPINFLLAKYYFKSLMALVISTPLASLFVGGVFVTSDYFSQGVTPTTVTESFTFLDQTEKKAISVGTYGYYAPLRPGKLKFDRNIEIMMHSFEDTSRDDIYSRPGRTTQPNPVHLDFDQDKPTLTSGWIKSRIPTYFHFREVKRSDLRVTFEKDSGGNYSAINGLGVDIQKLYFRAPNTTDVYHATKIGAGEKVVLKLDNTLRPPANLQNKVPSNIRNWIPLELDDGFANGEKRGRIGSGHYVAKTAGTAFFEEPQSGVIKKIDRGYIYGIQGDLTE